MTFTLEHRMPGTTELHSQWQHTLSYSPSIGSSLSGIFPVLDLHDKAKSILGSHAVSRFEKFKKFEDGWDDNCGKRLSPFSTACLVIFLNYYPNFGGSKPSLFLTRAGNLSLQWEDTTGGTIELEFMQNRSIEYFIERINEEAEIPLEEIQSLISKLQVPVS